MATAAGPETPRPNVKSGGGGMIPFRRATLRRTQLTTQTTGISVTAAQQDILVQIEGT